MKRFSAAIVVFSMVSFGIIGFASAEDSVCPPGAKFCPAPGVSGGDDSGGTYGSGTETAFGDSQGYFESQLHEGERLIMVAPGGQVDGFVDPSFASGEIFTAEPSYADSGSYSSGYDSYEMAESTPSMTGYDTSSSFNPDGFSSTYTEDFSQAGFSAEPQSSMPGYIPPPPGGGSSYSSDSVNSGGFMAAAPSLTLYEESGQTQQSTGRNYRQKKSGESPADLVASAPAVAPTMQMTTTAPRGYLREEISPSEDFELETPPTRTAMSSGSRRKKPETIPSREEVARVRDGRGGPDMLSEVANETSRKSSRASGSDYGDEYGKHSSAASYRGGREPVADDMVPWWKGGAWRNRKARKLEKEAAKAESKARKERDKMEREKAKKKAEMGRDERLEKDRVRSKKDGKRW